MNYTYGPIPDTNLFELRVNEIIFILDSADDFYSKMIVDFGNEKNIIKFADLLRDNPSTAFEIYNK